MSDKLPAVMAMKAGAKPVAIVPQTFEECYRMAKLLSMSAMVPDSFKGQPDDCCVAIMQGLEVGLSPIAALQSIAVINGRPTIWGDGALAVVRASGLLEYVKETDDGKQATCEVKRKEEPEPITRQFSQQDAERAGLLKVKEGKKPGPWHTYPARMRQMRARSWALRDGFADVLKGLHIAEEAQDIPMRDITPTKASTLTLPDIPDEPAKEPDAPQPQADTAQGKKPDKKPDTTDADYLEELAALFAATRDMDSLNEVLVHNEMETEDRGLQQAVRDIYEKHRTRIYDQMT